MQVLFELDLAGAAVHNVLEGFWSGRTADEEVRAFAEELVRGVIAERDDIDRRIAAAAEHWRLERMAAVDRNVLRMAIHEMLAGDNPAPVVIDEAIEIAKRFGSEGSGGFINGILDEVRVRIERERGGDDPARGDS